jgi:hypothetical protein
MRTPVTGLSVTGLSLIALCAGLLVGQVLIRPAIGQANNGDFPKMAGPLGLGPQSGDWSSHPQYGDLFYKYLRNDRYLYNTPFRSAVFLSSEYFFVKLPRGIQRIFRPGPVVDIRWIGAVHIVFFLAAISIWILALPPPLKLAAGLLAVFVWTDAAYAQYLNTFYMDTAAIIFLVMCAAGLLRSVVEPHSRMAPLIAVGAAILFTASKNQHAFPGLIFVPLFLAFAFRSRANAARAVWAAGAVLLPAAAYLVVAHAASDRGVPLFTVIFFRVAPESSDPLRTLRELGLGQNEVPYLGKFAYSSDVPMNDPVWVQQFNARCNYGSLARYYFRHPAVPLRMMWQTLSNQAAQIRPIANLSREDGFPLYSRTNKFVWWSNYRSRLLSRSPWHMVLLVLVVLGAAGWLFRFPGQRPLGMVALTIQGVALAEYAESVLLEAVETSRHLMLFHALTDLSILLLPLLIARLRASTTIFRVSTVLSAISRLRRAAPRGARPSFADESR